MYSLYYIRLRAFTCREQTLLASKHLSHLLVTLFCTLALILFNPIAHASSSGMSGYSGKVPLQTCASCHKDGNMSLRVGFHGPAQVKPGSITDYTLVLHSRQLYSAGYNVAASSGTLSSHEKLGLLTDHELHHREPYPADISGVISVAFQWHAPDQPGINSLHAYAVAANGDQTPLGDEAVYARFNVTVTDPDAPKIPPVATIRLPATANVGKPVFISGAQSDDADGEIVTYEWKFGNGDTQHGSRSTAKPVYNEPGSYPVELIVTDNDGLSSQTLAMINIIAPEHSISQAHGSIKADIQAPVAALLGSTVLFDAGKSKASHKEGRILSYSWDFGDGFAGDGEVVTHTYAETGVYRIALTVRDTNAEIDTASAVLTISPDVVAILHGVNPPEKIQLRDSDEIHFNIIPLVASIPELQDGVPRCGIAYLQRNGVDYQSQSICFTDTDPVGITFEHPFTRDDAPVVNWTAYVVMESGFETQHKTGTSRIVIEN